MGSKAQGVHERPLPIIFIAGEGLHHNIWSQSAIFVSNAGYNGLCLSLSTLSSPSSSSSSSSPSSSSSSSSTISPSEWIDHRVHLLHQSISHHKLTTPPPLLVAHSGSTFIAQKYLESFAAAGLVLLNPWPPHPKRVAEQLLLDWQSATAISSTNSESNANDSKTTNDNVNKSSSSSSCNRVVEVLSRYYRIPGGSFVSSGGDLESLEVLRWCAEYGDLIAVDLEAGAVPTMILTSAGDVINEEEIESLKQQHNVPDEWHMKIDSDLSRAAMLRESSCDIVNNVLLNWVEECIL